MSGKKGKGGHVMQTTRAESAAEEEALEQERGMRRRVWAKDE